MKENNEIILIITSIILIVINLSIYCWQKDFEKKHEVQNVSTSYERL